MSAGYPVTCPSGLTTGFLNIGAVQMGAGTKGYPGVFPAELTTGKMTIGAVQLAAASAVAFNFTNQTNVGLGSVITSNTITTSGGYSGQAVSASAGVTFSINGGAYGTTGTSNSGDTIVAKMTSSGSLNTD